MTPGSSVGFGLGDRPVAVGCRGHSKAMTGLPGEAAAQHVAAGDARVPGAGSITDALTDPRPPAAVGLLSERTPVTPIVEARGLTKRFGRTQALAGLDLVAQPGRVVALLGPNGAGKTTFVRSVATLLRPDAGSLQVAGIDALRHPARVRQVIGLAGQFAAVEPAMTGRENLEMVGRLFGLKPKQARAAATAVLEQIQLTGDAGRLVRTYSGGMRRRLDLGAGLVGAPRLLLLDEPTTGLDPGSRVQLWYAIRELVAAGTDVC